MTFVVTFMPVNRAESHVLDGHGIVTETFNRETIIAQASLRLFGNDSSIPEHTQPNNEAGAIIVDMLGTMMPPELLSNVANTLHREWSVPAYKLAAQLSLMRIARQRMQVRGMLANNLAALQQLAYFDRCVSDAVCAAAAGMYSDIRITMDIEPENDNG